MLTCSSKRAPVSSVLSWVNHYVGIYVVKYIVFYCFFSLNSNYFLLHICSELVFFFLLSDNTSQRFLYVSIRVNLPYSYCIILHCTDKILFNDFANNGHLSCLRICCCCCCSKQCILLTAFYMLLGLCVRFLLQDRYRREICWVKRFWHFQHW